MRAGRLVQNKGTQTYTIEPEATLRAAATIMHHQQVGALIVVNDQNEPVGLITERDIVTALYSQGPAAAIVTVGDMMRPVPHCDESDTLEHVMTIMTNQRTRHVLVYEPVGLVGILSIGDVVKHRLIEAEEEARMTLNYIWTGR